MATTKGQPICFWLSETGGKQVILEVSRNRDVKPRPISSGAIGISMRAYAIALLHAKYDFERCLANGRSEIQALKDCSVVFDRSTGANAKKNFLNSVAPPFTKNSAAPPNWLKDIRDVLEGDDPLLVGVINEARLELRLGPCWLKYDFELRKYNQHNDRRSDIDNLLEFAASLEAGCEDWTDKIAQAKWERNTKSPTTFRPTVSRLVGDAAKSTLEFYKEQFDDYLTKTLKDIEEGPWWKLYQDRAHPDNKFAQLGQRIGELQREKQAGRLAVKDVPIKGDIDFVLESTHEVFFSATRDYPEIGRAFDSLIDALEVIDHAANSLSSLKLETLRTDWMRDVGRKFAHGRIYLLLLYFTYLEIEAPKAPRTIRSRNLLDWPPLVIPL